MKKTLNVLIFPLIIGFLLSIIISNSCDNSAAAVRIDEIIDASAAITAEHERKASEAAREAERQAMLAESYRKESAALQGKADAARAAGEKIKEENEALKEIIATLQGKTICTGFDFSESSRLELIELSRNLCHLQGKNSELITGLNKEIDTTRIESRALRASLAACRKESGSLRAEGAEYKAVIFEKSQIIKQFQTVTIPDLKKEAKRKRGFWFRVRYAAIGAGAAALLDCCGKMIFSRK